RGAHPDPRFEIGNRGSREFRLRRHSQLVVFVTHRLDDQALRGLARNQPRTGSTALAKGVARVESQLSLDLLGIGAVTGVAVLDKQRTNALLEERDPLRVRLGRHRSTWQQDHEQYSDPVAREWRDRHGSNPIHNGNASPEG